MNQFLGLSLKALRKTYGIIFGHKSFARPDCEQDPDIVAKLIHDELTKSGPCMIARFGANEITCLTNYLGIYEKETSTCSFIRGETPPWWWQRFIIKQIHIVAGFFPPTEEKIEQFCELMFKDIPLVDILGSWMPQEHYFEVMLDQHKKASLIYLDPFWAEHPWTRALEGKKVLVIHPFIKTIKKQFKKRTLLFKDHNILPDFELKTIKAVQSAAGNSTEFKDWFGALHYMKEAMDRVDYDICLIGAGAYGFPLAAHAKRTGNKGFHMGGSLQLLFGIKGNRWENPDYKSDLGLNYLSLFNEHWVRPMEEERPKGADKVENATYW